MAGPHPDAALAVLEQRRHEHAFVVGVADRGARHDMVAQQARHTDARPDPQAAAAIQRQRRDVRRGQAVRGREQPIRPPAAAAAQALGQCLPQRPIRLAHRRLDVLGPVAGQRDRVLLDAAQGAAAAEHDGAARVLVDRCDAGELAAHEDQRVLRDAADRVAAGDPDDAALILVERADRAGQADLAELLEHAVAPAQDRAVVGADPEPVDVVDEQRRDVGRLQRGGAVAIEGLELDAVEADQPRLRAQPEEAVAVLRQRPDAVGRQAVTGLPAFEVVLGERLRHGAGRPLCEGRASRQDQERGESGGKPRTRPGRFRRGACMDEGRRRRRGADRQTLVYRSASRGAPDQPSGKMLRLRLVFAPASAV